MTAGDVLGWIVTYVFAGACVGGAGLPAIDIMKERGTIIFAGYEQAAVLFLVGLFWPITAPFLAVWYLVLAGRGIGRGLVQLWWRWRTHRAAKKAAYAAMRSAQRAAQGKPDLPRAKARRRTP